jgi:hypothetical protein
LIRRNTGFWRTSRQARCTQDAVAPEDFPDLPLLVSPDRNTIKSLVTPHRFADHLEVAILRAVCIHVTAAEVLGTTALAID